MRDKSGCVEVDGERITIFSLNTSDSYLTSVRA